MCAVHRVSVLKHAFQGSLFISIIVGLMSVTMPPLDNKHIEVFEPTQFHTFSLLCNIWVVINDKKSSFAAPRPAPRPDNACQLSRQTFRSLKHAPNAHHVHACNMSADASIKQNGAKRTVDINSVFRAAQSRDKRHQKPIHPQVLRACQGGHFLCRFNVLL